MYKIDTIRYMGIKSNLLDHIIPAIREITPENGVVLDIMAGSNAVAYALKEYFTVYTNDIQEYSHTISNAIIVNQHICISSNSAREDLFDLYSYNKKCFNYSFFSKVYSGTYFSEKQCNDIDSIRYAISQIDVPEKQSLYLFALMGAMCKVQSTPGHFAQYMPATHSRIIPLQNMNLLEEFYEKCNLYSDLLFTDKKNKAFCMDYHTLLEEKKCTGVNTIYLDSPYTQEQYSRFYHILETVCKYDNPTVNFKAKYRDDRFQSGFCYKGKVKEEFECIFQYCKENHTNLVLSYSDKGLIDVSELNKLAQQFFDRTNLKLIDYKHSTQGKGSNKLHEILLSCQMM